MLRARATLYRIPNITIFLSVDPLEGPDLDEDEMNLLLRILPSFVMTKKVENGILIAPHNQPEFGRIVETSPDIRDKVWKWIKKPKDFKNKEDWIKIREPVIELVFTAFKIMIEYGPPENRNIFRSTMEEFLNRMEQEKI